MCGIVGYIGKANAPTVLINGRRRLEYRGYDSAGLAIIDDERIINRAISQKASPSSEPPVEEKNYGSRSVSDLAGWPIPRHFRRADCLPTMLPITASTRPPDDAGPLLVEGLFSDSFPKRLE